MKAISLISVFLCISLALMVLWIIVSEKFKLKKSTTILISCGMILVFFFLPLCMKMILTDGFLCSVTDQEFMMQYIQKYQHHHAYVDPLIKNYSPFYPPLFFYVSGKIGQLFDPANILLTYNLGSFVSLIILLISLFWLIAASFRDCIEYPDGYLIFFFVFLFFALMDFDYLFGKPYEGLAFVIMLFVIKEIELKRKEFSVLKTGVLLAIVIMLYFLPLLFFVPSMLVYLLVQKEDRWIMARKSLQALAISLLLSSPYVAPLAFQMGRSWLAAGGNANYADISAHTFFPHIPDLTTLQGLISLISMIGLFVIFKGKQRLFKITIVAIYVVFFLNLLAVAFLKVSFLVTPPVWSYAQTLFFFSCILFIKESRPYWQRHFSSETRKNAVLFSLVFFVIVAFGELRNSTLFRNNQIIKRERQLKENKLARDVYNAFSLKDPNIISDQMGLALHFPFFFFLPDNLVYANPFCDIEGRCEYLQKMTSLSGRELQRAFCFSPFGKIDGLVGIEKEGVINLLAAREWHVQAQSPHRFAFKTANFSEPYFIKKNIGGLTVVKPIGSGL